ncbi:MAG TPA: mechanosensitive ion channel family protein [Candidatus Limnocylindria bacterium]|nr:mechanosensitive ion channel family protein [Candidatus Limnocylindria bacterium]
MTDLHLPNWATTALQVGGIVLVGLVAYALLRTAARIGVRHLLERQPAAPDETVLPALELERRVTTIERLTVRVGATLVTIIALLMILAVFDIDIGPAVAGLGVVGIAVGLGAQTLVKDWLAGIFIVLENQYSAGDVVAIAGVEGTVEDFSLRRTTLRDLDGTVHSVPNGQIVVASNHTRVWARVNLDIGVAYDTDIERASVLIDRIGADLATDEEWRDRLIEPPTVIRINALGDSGVTLKVLGRVRAAEQWAVAGELRKRILAAFAREGIEVPYPRRVMVTQPPTVERDAEAERPDATSGDSR